MTRVYGRPFEKGKSGNPGGRKKSIVKQLAEQESEEAFKRIIELSKDKGLSAKDRLMANVYIVDRAEGKPTQAISGPDEGPLQHEHALPEDIAEMIKELVGDTPGA